MLKVDEIDMYSITEASQKMQKPKRRKRVFHNIRNITINRGVTGFGFTIAGEGPCTLSYVAPGGAADAAGLRRGDRILAVADADVSAASHDDVVRLVGSAVNALRLHVAERSEVVEDGPRGKRAAAPRGGDARSERQPLADRNLNEDDAHGRRAGSQGYRYKHFDFTGRRGAEGHASGRGKESDAPGRGKDSDASRRGKDASRSTRGDAARREEAGAARGDSSRGRRDSSSVPRNSLLQTIGSGAAEEEEARESPAGGGGRQERSVEGFYKCRSNKAVVELLLEQRNNQQQQHHHQQHQQRQQQQPMEWAPSGGDGRQVALCSSLPTVDLSSVLDSRASDVYAGSYRGSLPRDLAPPHDLLLSRDPLPSQNAAPLPHDPVPPRELPLPHDLAPLRNLAPLRDPVPPLDSAAISDHEVALSVVVAYVGSVDLPATSDAACRPDDRLRAVRHCVQRLRRERRPHAHVVMEVSGRQVALLDRERRVVAAYPADEIAFCGVCPDDKRFVGVATLRADDDDDVGVGACHVFFVDPRLRAHDRHAATAAALGVRCSGGAAGEACAAFPRSASPILRAIATLYRQNSDESTASHVSSLESESRARTEASTATQYAQMRYTWSGASVSSRASSESAAEPSPREGPAETTNEAEEAGDARHRVDLHDPMTSEVAAATTHAGGRDARGVESRAHQVAAPQDDGCSRASWSASASLPVPAVVAQPACRESAKPDARSIAGFDVRSVSKSIRSTDSSDASIHLAALLPPSPRARGTVAPRLQQVAPFPRSFRAAADEPNSAENLRASFRKLAETRKRQMAPRAPSPVRAASDAGGPPAKMQSLASGAQDGPLPMETWSVEGEVKMELAGNESMRESFTDNATTIVGKTSVETDGTNDAVFLHPGPVKVERVHSWSRGRSLHGGRKQSNANRSHESLAALKYHLDVPGRGWTTGSGQNLSELTDAAPGDVGVRTHGRVAGWAVCFERLLEDPSGQLVFTDFLKKQFSVENIVFWNTVKDFKKTCDSNTRQKLAQDIYARFIAEGASESVNVDSTARQNVEDDLSSPHADMFNAAEKQVYHLMKFDCYSRFIKDDLYKDCLLCEIEGRPLPYEENESPRRNVKKKKKNKDEDDRRRSLLPWNKVTKKNIKRTESDQFSLRSSRSSLEGAVGGWGSVGGGAVRQRSLASCADLHTMEKSASVASIASFTSRESLTSLGRLSNTGDLGVRLCRIRLPNGSTSVMPANPGQTVRAFVMKMLEKKKQDHIKSFDVLFHDSEQVLDQSQDISVLASKEIRVEQRVVFTAEMPSGRTVGAKVAAGSSIGEALPSLLQKFNLKPEAVSVCLAGSMVPLESSASVVTIDGEKIVVRELGAAAPPVSRLSGKPPLPSIRKKDASRQRPSSDDSSSGEGKFSICSPFSRWTPEARDKKGHTKVKPPGSELTHRASTGNSPRPIKTRTFKRADDTDVMLDMVAKAQSRRMDDQRGSLSLKDLELPDFLRVKPGSHQGKEYRPSSCGNSLSSSRLDSDISWSITPIKQYPSEGVQRGLTPLRGGGDRSFSGDGVLPSHERAERYFGARTSVARSPDFDDSRLCERSLADIGMRGGATVDEAAEDSPSVSGGACDATVLRAPSGDLDATLTSGSTPRTADRSSEGRARGDGGSVGRVNVGSAFEGGRARSYENVRAGATGAALVGKRVLGAAAGDAAAVGAPLRISTSADGHTESLV